MGALTRPETTTVYAVYWPPEGDGIGVLKVGREKNERRHKLWVRRGATLLATFADVPIAWERAVLEELRGQFIRAFDSEADAKWLLGHGYGYTECFIVLEHQRLEALQMITRVISQQVQQ